MSAIDTIISAVTAQIRASGLLESGTIMATVSAVGADGTITATHGTNTYPRVRVLTALGVAVGDRVEIMRTLGGWVCLGRLMSASGGAILDMRGGMVTITHTANDEPASATVTYPTLSGTTFHGIATARTSGAYTVVREVTTATFTATSMVVAATRADLTGTPPTPKTTNVDWIAFSL